MANVKDLVRTMGRYASIENYFVILWHQLQESTRYCKRWFDRSNTSPMILLLEIDKLGNFVSSSMLSIVPLPDAMFSVMGI